MNKKGLEIGTVLFSVLIIIIAVVLVLTVFVPKYKKAINLTDDVTDKFIDIDDPYDLVDVFDKNVKSGNLGNAVKVYITLKEWEGSDVSKVKAEAALELIKNDAVKICNNKDNLQELVRRCDLAELKNGE